MKEKRKSTRSDMEFPVSVWVSTFEKFWNGYSINICKDGALIHINKFCSLEVGQQLEINFPRTLALARRKGQTSRIKQAKIKRKWFESGGVTMAVEFIRDIKK